MGILFSCCMNGNPNASIPENDDGYFKTVLHKFKQQIMQRNEYEDISSSPSTSEALEDTNLVGNQPNIVISAPQPLELDVAVSRGMSDNAALVVEENRGYKDLRDTQIEGIMQPYLCDDEEEPSLPDICNQLYRVILSPDEEDVCPTCLEDYDPNNPKILTECSHHFHLSCIYAWMERSNTCPVCFRVMVFDEAA